MKICSYCVDEDDNAVFGSELSIIFGVSYNIIKDYPFV